MKEDVLTLQELIFAPMWYPLEELVEELEYHTGVDDDHIRIVLCMVIQVLLGWLMWLFVNKNET